MPKNHLDDYIFFGLLIIPIGWLCLLIAPHLSNGLIYALPEILESMNDPFHITWCNNSARVLIFGIALYLFSVMIYLSDRKNYRHNEEYGSAKWGNTFLINLRFSQKPYSYNKLLSQHLRIGLNTWKHQRNLHTLIVGGSGAGKTRGYCKPNIMQCNSSFVIIDPKGEILRDVGYLLEKEGYVVKVFDVLDMGKSHGYNPFKYIREDNDILILVTNLINNTTPKGASSNDPFWDRSEQAFLSAIFLYLYHEAPEEEQNFGMLLEMIEAASVSEDNEDYMSALDILFERLNTKNPDSLAYKQYAIYKKAPPKTAMSILISVGVRMAKFYLLKGITTYDELELEKMGDRKQALFCIIPDSDSTFNFLVGMLYTQLFQMLYRKADRFYKGALKVPVHFVMDEFANVSLPDEFGKLLATMRSRMVFVSIIIQNLDQLKGMFKDSWESIIGLCDQFYYIGGNEMSTFKFVSEYIGKATIDVKTYSKSSGSHGSYTTNYTKQGRDLLTVDEVRTLDDRYGLAVIRSQRIVYDKKYDLNSHPNIKYTTHGGAPAYEHGKDNHSIQDWQNILIPDDDFEIYTEKDIDDYLKRLDEQKKLEEILNESRKKTI